MTRLRERINMFDQNVNPVDLYVPNSNTLLYKQTTHYKIARLLDKQSKVLDIGCGVGYLSKKFKDKGCFVAGLEIDESSARKAMQICDEVIIADIELADRLPWDSRYFDYVIFCDVLEHFKRPDIVLRKIKPYLTEHGLVIAAIPNIAWISIRLQLLLGQFDYKDSGILDKTHLRFFTLNSMKYLFESAGYKIKHIDYVGSGIMPTLMALKFIIVAQMSNQNNKAG